MMTREQFIHWLEGFLEGTNSSENPSLQRIKEKFDSIQPYNTHPPYVDGKGHPNPYYFTTTTGTSSSGINPTGRPDVTTANVDSTPTSEKKLLTENED